MKYLLSLFFSTFLLTSSGQTSYKDSIRHFLDEYVKNHEVVTGADKKSLRFFPIDESYRVIATFEPASETKWFSMETSGTIKKIFRVYGTLHFTIHDTLVTLNIYQSQGLMQLGQYKDLLFLPFTDLSSGGETYATGRYIDLAITDIKEKKLIVDFNKAYNPYCAYVSGKYNCPIPPRENQLPVRILAGEKVFGKRE